MSQNFQIYIAKGSDIAKNSEIAEDSDIRECENSLTSPASQIIQLVVGHS
jgi:hypothetical protein